MIQPIDRSLYICQEAESNFINHLQTANYNRKRKHWTNIHKPAEQD